MTHKTDKKACKGGGCKSKRPEEAQKKCCSAKKDERIQELIDDLKRLQAEFENYKKRCEKENSRFREFSNAELVKNLLPVVDSFEMALKNTEDPEKFISGVKMIFGQLMQALSEEGLERMDVIGKRIDSSIHDVLLSEKSDEEEDTVLEELQAGYTLKDSVLRHAKVKISKN